MPVRDFGILLGVILLTRVGQALLLSGCVRSKNAASVAVRCVLDLAVVMLALWAVGGIFMPRLTELNTRPWINVGHVLGGDGGRTLLLLPALLLSTGATLGATAERLRLAPQLVLGALTASLTLPLLWRVGLVWYGNVPGTDAGLTAGLIGGGVAAIVLAYLAGPRKDKFNRDQSANFVPGHSVVFQIVGLLILAAGFCVAARNGLHGVLGLCAATLAGAWFGHAKFGKIDAGLLMAAGVGGLCAAGLAAGIVGGPSMSWIGPNGSAAVLAGAIAGVAVPWAVMTLETRFRIDDVAGFGVAYAVGGTSGLLVAALTRRTSTVVNYLTAWGLDTAFCAVTVVVCGGLALIVGKLFASRGTLRVSETVEYDGADLSELDVNAYPDFQQTMIKSHHLRQL